MYKALKPGGVLQFIVQGFCERALRYVGFELQSIPGPPGKEISRALKHF